MSARRSFLRDVLSFVWRDKGEGRRLWLLPILVVLIVVSILAAVGALAPYATFIYPL